MQAGKKDRRHEVAEVPEYLRELVSELPVMVGIKQAAAVLNMHARTVQRILAAGEMRGIRPKLSGGSRVIIPRSEIVRYLVEHPAR
jgi:excisionase family DNA binding protein